MSKATLGSGIADRGLVRDAVVGYAPLYQPEHPWGDFGSCETARENGRGGFGWMMRSYYDSVQLFLETESAFVACSSRLAAPERQKASCSKTTP